MTSFCRFTFYALLFTIYHFADGQQKSFAETQFDLPPDLPAEEPPPIAANQDQSPSTANVPQTPPPPPPTQPPPPPPPPPSTVQTPPPTLVNLVPSSSTQALLLSTQFSSAFTGMNEQTTMANSKTPLPMLPTLVDLPRFVQNGNVQPITVPSTLIEPGGANQTNTNILLFTQTTDQQNLIPIASSPPSIKAPLAKLPPLWQISTAEQQVWFRDDFDINDCPRNAEAIGKYFRKKFPKNLLRHQKETVLAELLAIRLRECLKKQREEHWIRLDKQLDKGRIEGDSNESEREECRAALVQEQIACMNLQSFSCQFIQPTFLFRLIPARLIVQEARLAEDGAERCRKFSLISGNRKLPSRNR